jgi:hypothetical protein
MTVVASAIADPEVQILCDQADFTAPNRNLKPGGSARRKGAAVSRFGHWILDLFSF